MRQFKYFCASSSKFIHPVPPSQTDSRDRHLPDERARAALNGYRPGKRDFIDFLTIVKVLVE